MHNRAAHLFAREREIPDKVALVFGAESWTYAELADEVRRTAGGLAHLGVGQGARVGISLRSGPAFIFVQQAVFLLGAVLTPLNIMLQPNEVWQASKTCALDWIVCTSSLAHQLCGEGVSFPCELITTDDPSPAHSLSEAIRASTRFDAMADVALEDTVMLLLTSATTGAAKGVMLTAANLEANYDRTPQWLGLDADTRIYCALPLYNTFGLNQCINAALVTGGMLVLAPRFESAQAIAAIEQHRCTFLPAVPTMLQKILDHPDANADRLGSLKRIMTGGAPVPTAMLRRLLDAAPDVTLLTGYGLTEGTALVSLARVELGADGEVIRGRTIGRVLDGMSLAIRREDGTEADTGEPGEIVIKGPNVMAGYFRAAEHTDMAVQDGWLLTGDIGYLDSDGYAFIVDRKKDVIIRAGQNIYPADIEDALYQVRDVAEAAVVAQPDDLLGEVPIAFVALTPGSTLTAATLLDHCRARLALYKLPAAVRFMDELPKGPTGKILRRALRPQAHT